MLNTRWNQQTRRPGSGPKAADKHARHSRQLVLRASQQQQQTQQQQANGSPPVYIQDSKTQAFLEWAKGAGVSFAGVRPAAFGGVRGLAASGDINAEELLISVPRTAAMTLAPKQRCPCPDFVSVDYWAAAPWFVRMGILLLNEKRKGSASQLAQYLSQLPTSVDSPVNWTQQQLQQLQYPYLIQQVTQQQQQEWRELYARFAAALQGGASVSQADFYWALSIVRSRTFSGPYVGSTLSSRIRLAGLVAALVAGNTLLNPGADLQRTFGAAVAVFLFNIMYELILSQRLKQYAMCPVIDLLNHSSTEASEVTYDYFQDAYSVATSRAYQPGQQVFVSYGTQSNDSLLQFYGFSDPDNPADTYVLTRLLQWLQQLQPVPQSRLDALKDAGLLESLQQPQVTRTGVAGATLQALRYLLAPDAAAAKGPGAFVEASGAEAEQKLALALVHAVQSELGALGSSLEEDQKALPGCKGSAAAAVAFRIEKKKVLRSCLAALRGAEQS